MDGLIHVERTDMRGPAWIGGLIGSSIALATCVVDASQTSVGRFTLFVCGTFDGRLSVRTTTDRCGDCEDNG